METLESRESETSQAQGYSPYFMHYLLDAHDRSDHVLRIDI